MGIEEENGWIMKKKGRMAKEREFTLLEMLRLWVYSIENFIIMLRNDALDLSHCLSPFAPFIG